MIAIEQAANDIQHIGETLNKITSIRDETMQKIKAERLHLAEVEAENEEKRKIKTICELLQSLDLSKIKIDLPTSERFHEAFIIMNNLKHEAFKFNKFEFDCKHRLAEYEKTYEEANAEIARESEMINSAYGVLRYQMDIVQRKLNGFLEDSNIVMERHNTNSSQIPQQSAFQPADEISMDNA